MLGFGFMWDKLWLSLYRLTTAEEFFIGFSRSCWLRDHFNIFFKWGQLPMITLTLTLNRLEWIKCLAFVLFVRLYACFSNSVLFNISLKRALQKNVYCISLFCHVWSKLCILVSPAASFNLINCLKQARNHSIRKTSFNSAYLYDASYGLHRDKTRR